MTDTKPTIDEQIADQKDVIDLHKRCGQEGCISMESAKLSSLEELKRIQSAEMPEPVAWATYTNGIFQAAFNHKENADYFVAASKGGPLTQSMPLYGPELLANAQRKDAEAREQREEHQELLGQTHRLLTATSQLNIGSEEGGPEAVINNIIHGIDDLLKRAESLEKEKVALIAENEGLRKDAEASQLVECECPVEGHATGCPNDLMTRLRQSSKPDGVVVPKIELPEEMPKSLVELLKFPPTPRSGEDQNDWYLRYWDVLLHAAKEQK